MAQDGRSSLEVFSEHLLIVLRDLADHNILDHSKATRIAESDPPSSAVFLKLRLDFAATCATTRRNDLYQDSFDVIGEEHFLLAVLAVGIGRRHDDVRDEILLL